MRPLKHAFAYLTVLVSMLCSQVPAQAVDYPKAGEEAADLLAKYIQIDTTVPPGNEQKGAVYLAAIFKREGIDAQVLPVVPGRACVYARLKGNGKKKAIVLLSHIDVVPAEPKDWKYPPFSGEVHDGELWGRGAIDMKGMGIIELEAMLMIKRSGVKLDRDIIFIATPDEEVGGEFGAGWFKKNHADLVKDAEFLLNEGSGVDSDANGKPIYWAVDVAEKNPLWLKLTAKGNAGHASMPMINSAPNRLVRALNKLVNSPVELTVLPVVQRYFRDIAPMAPAEMRPIYQNLTAAGKDPHAVELLMSDMQKSSMLRNTVSLTVMKAGYKTNVIPAEATAELDCRLLPSIDPDKFTEEIKKKLGDSSIEISRIEWESAEASPVDTELFAAIKRVAARENPPVPVVPVIVQWFTDSHWFRELGIHSYGFMPSEITAELLSSVHGKNERIPLAYLTNGVRRMYDLLFELGTSK